MHTFPYGMELEAIDRYRDEVDPAAARERLGLPQDATVVLCLGTLEPRKGQAVLAQAFGAIASRHPDAILAIVGDLGGEYSTGLHAYLDRAGLGDQVRVEPLATDPYAWHVAADVFALASDIESSPIVVLEAMAFGTPVVATAVFGVPELIEDGTHGYLCEASDIDSLGTALERALDDPARDEVGRAGERRVRERHDPDRYAERMSALMAGLVEGGAPARPASRCAGSVRADPHAQRGATASRARSRRCEPRRGWTRLEILVADSGSDDDTVSLAERAGARVLAVDGGEFNHGAVRNQLAGEAGGDVLVTTVQDATLSRATALRELAEALEDDAGLAGVSATQQPGPGADLFSRWSAWLHSQLPRRGDTLDNVCAAIRPAAWEQLRFRELEFGEDLDFARRAAAAGWRVACVRAGAGRPPPRPPRRPRVRPRGRPSHAAGPARGRTSSATPWPRRGSSALLAALPTLLGRLQAAQDEAMPEDGAMSPARFLRRVSNGLRDVPGAAEPRGELESIAALCAAEAAPPTARCRRWPTS